MWCIIRITFDDTDYFELCLENVALGTWPSDGHCQLVSRASIVSPLITVMPPRRVMDSDVHSRQLWRCVIISNCSEKMMHWVPYLQKPRQVGVLGTCCRVSDHSLGPMLLHQLSCTYYSILTSSSLVKIELRKCCFEFLTLERPLLTFA